jgi:5-methylcytosine-specific restriction endonuclease McrA
VEKHVFKRTKNKKKIEKMFQGKKMRPCVYCGKSLTLKTATFDHVKPLSAGGYDRNSNGAIACESCNNAKGSMTKGEFMLKNGGIKK